MGLVIRAALRHFLRGDGPAHCALGRSFQQGAYHQSLHCAVVDHDSVVWRGHWVFHPALIQNRRRHWRGRLHTARQLAHRRLLHRSKARHRTGGVLHGRDPRQRTGQRLWWPYRADAGRGCGQLVTRHRSGLAVWWPRLGKYRGLAHRVRRCRPAWGAGRLAGLGEH